MVIASGLHAFSVIIWFQYLNTNSSFANFSLLKKQIPNWNTSKAKVIRGCAFISVQASCISLLQYISSKTKMVSSVAFSRHWLKYLSVASLRWLPSKKTRPKVFWVFKNAESVASKFPSCIVTLLIPKAAWFYLATSIKPAEPSRLVTFARSLAKAI